MFSRKLLLTGTLALLGAVAFEGNVQAQQPVRIVVITVAPAAPTVPAIPGRVVKIGATGQTVKQPNVCLIPPALLLLDRFTKVVEPAKAAAK